jgi:VanZ family protein
LRAALARVPARLWTWLFVLAQLVLLVAALLPVPAHMQWVPLVDKLEHMAAFFALTWLGRLAGVRPLWRLALMLVGLGVAIELVQALTSWRQGDVLDAVADTLGVALGLLLPLPAALRLASAEPGKNGR